MSSLISIDDNFSADTASSIVIYFLANAKTWRGETARKIKAELMRMYKSASTYSGEFPDAYRVQIEKWTANEKLRCVSKNLLAHGETVFRVHSETREYLAFFKADILVSLLEINKPRISESQPLAKKIF